MRGHGAQHDIAVRDQAHQVVLGIADRQGAHVQCFHGLGGMDDRIVRA
jgi:hypothetical protein